MANAEKSRAKARRLKPAQGAQKAASDSRAKKDKGKTAGREPRLLTRPEVAQALDVSERTARRMAADPACPLGQGRRINRKLHWTAEEVEDARLWRAEQGGAAEPAAARVEAPAAVKPAKKSAKKTPAKAGKSASAKGAPERGSRAPEPAAKADTPRAAATSAAGKPAAAPARPAPADDAPIMLDEDTVAALLPLLGLDSIPMSPRKRAALLRQVGDALMRHLSEALTRAKQEAGLMPEEPWLALNSLNRYEARVMARSARMAAELVPPRGFSSRMSAPAARRA